MRRRWNVMGKLWGTGVLLLGGLVTSAESACSYFSAVGKDVDQPAQKAFITWDPVEQIESFIVQPQFKGNAEDFGMVIPTPARPKLHPAPREFFKELGVFTILKPMPMEKYKNWNLQKGAYLPAMMESDSSVRLRASTVKILEAGVVGSLDYKIISAERADDLYDWLKEHKYSFAGDEATLEFYVKKNWMFTVMKIDPKQMKKAPDGTYTGEVTPTLFQFSSKELVYPVHITQLSVKDQTEALFYVQAPFMVDLPGDWSWHYNFVPMFVQAMGFAIPDKLSPAEKTWKEALTPQVNEFTQYAAKIQQKAPVTTLEWAKRVTDKDVDMLDGTVKYDRDADADAVKNLKILKGFVKKGQFITKFRKVFKKGEMTQDLVLSASALKGGQGDLEYIEIMPTSPP